VKLVKYWEKLTGERIGEAFRIPRKADRFKREAKFAQDLIDEADGDMDVSTRALWILFNDTDFSWKFYTSLLTARTDWIAAIFLARQYIKKEKLREARERELMEEMEDMEDVWKTSPGD
jgi:hypothetical protein